MNDLPVAVVSSEEVSLDKESDGRKHGFGGGSPGFPLEERGICTSPIPN
jgi:hypothetical protein